MRVDLTKGVSPSLGVDFPASREQDSHPDPLRSGHRPVADVPARSGSSWERTSANGRVGRDKGHGRDGDHGGEDQDSTSVGGRARARPDHAAGRSGGSLQLDPRQEGTDLRLNEIGVVPLHEVAGVRQDVARVGCHRCGEPVLQVQPDRFSSCRMAAARRTGW
jgi:hypothetical protein